MLKGTRLAIRSLIGSSGRSQCTHCAVPGAYATVHPIDIRARRGYVKNDVSAVVCDDTPTPLVRRGHVLFPSYTFDGRWDLMVRRRVKSSKEPWSNRHARPPIPTISSAWSAANSGSVITFVICNC